MKEPRKGSVGSAQERVEDPQSLRTIVSADQSPRDEEVRARKSRIKKTLTEVGKRFEWFIGLKRCPFDGQDALLLLAGGLTGPYFQPYLPIACMLIARSQTEDDAHCGTCGWGGVGWGV